MSKVLLTGAAGFVGSHIAEALSAAGYSVICAVKKTSNLKWLKRLPVKYEYGSLNDKNFLNRVVRDVDFIVHCAGIVRALDKEEYFKNNTVITADLCRAVIENNDSLKKFIFISSQAAMGPSSVERIRNVSDVPEPISDYGLSKIEAETQLKRILCGKIPYTVFRPAAVYGPRDKDIFIFFNLVHRHLRPVTVKKRFLQLIYVKDIARCVLSCFWNINTGNKTYYIADPSVYTWSDIGRIISLSSGVRSLPLPVPDFVFKTAGFVMERLSKITGKPAVLNKQKVSEILQNSWTADTVSAENALNIKFTCLEIASKITYNWYLENNWF